MIEKMEAIVLFSGGMDSTLILHQCLAEWQGKCDKLRKGRNVKNAITRVHAVSFAYGQRHHKELDFAARYLEGLGKVTHQVVHLDFDWLRSPLLSSHRGVDPDETPVIPGRNSIMISIAVSIAMERGSQMVFIGCNKTDWDVFPDCRPIYMRAINEVSLLQGGVHLIAPLIGMTKEDIVEAGKQYNIDWSNTWSCYKGEKEPCGECAACKERSKAGV